MAHFAELDRNNLVLKVVVVSNEVLKDPSGHESEALGVAFCQNLFGIKNWKQTSFNGSIRKNFASIGYVYDNYRDAFIAPQPFPSWVLDEVNCTWTAPLAYPGDLDHPYRWDEYLKNWVAIRQS
jgi:hypothetical protein